MVRESRARMCGWDCKPALHHLRTEICQFLTRTQRDLDAPGVLCSPQVRRKLINRVPRAYGAARKWRACVYKVLHIYAAVYV